MDLQKSATWSAEAVGGVFEVGGRCFPPGGLLWSKALPKENKTNAGKCSCCRCSAEFVDWLHGKPVQVPAAMICTEAAPLPLHDPADLLDVKRPDEEEAEGFTVDDVPPELIDEHFDPRDYE